MVDALFSTSNLLGVDVNDTSTTPLFPLGTTTQGTNNSEFVYVQAAGAIDKFDFVAIDEDYQATATILASQSRGDLGGVAVSAFADNDYGWICRKGAQPANIKVSAGASCAPNVVLYVTATAGMLDDATVSGAEAVEGIILNETNSTVAGAAAECVLNYPEFGASA